MTFSSAAISAGSGSRPSRWTSWRSTCVDPVQLLDHVNRDADRPRLVGDRPRHRLADPPGRVGRELVAAPVVELLDRPDQPQRPLLDQVEEARARGPDTPSRSTPPGAGSPPPCAASRSCRRARSASPARSPDPRSAARPARSSAGRAAASRGSARPSGPARASSPGRAGPLLRLLVGGQAVLARSRRRRARPGTREGPAPAPWSPRPPRASRRSARRSGTRAPGPGRSASAARRSPETGSPELGSRLPVPVLPGGLDAIVAGKQNLPLVSHFPPRPLLALGVRAARSILAAIACRAYAAARRPLHLTSDERNERRSLAHSHRRPGVATRDRGQPHPRRRRAASRR